MKKVAQIADYQQINANHTVNYYYSAYAQLHNKFRKNSRYMQKFAGNRVNAFFSQRIRKCPSMWGCFQILRPRSRGSWHNNRGFRFRQ